MKNKQNNKQNQKTKDCNKDCGKRGEGHEYKRGGNND